MPYSMIKNIRKLMLKQMEDIEGFVCKKPALEFREHRKSQDKRNE